MDFIYYYVIQYFKPEDFPTGNSLQAIEGRRYISGLILINTSFATCLTWLLVYRLITVSEPTSTYLVFFVTLGFLAQNFLIKLNFKPAQSLWFMILSLFVAYPFRLYTTGGLFAPNVVFIGMAAFTFVVLNRYVVSQTFMVFMLCFITVCGYLGTPRVEVSEVTILVTIIIMLILTCLLTSIDRYLKFKAEKDLLKEQEKKANAEMALELSHEINNPLSIALVLSSKLKSGKLKDKDKEVLADNIERIVKVVKEIQGF